MALPDGFLDELRARVSLARIAERSLTWERGKTRPSRGEYWACCPFHQEKSASFKIDDKAGRYYCFGCQAKGDAIGFVMQTGNMGFIEAVESLAAEAGMTMPARDPQAAEKAREKAGLSEIMEDAVRFCRMQLRMGPAQAARDYLARRGLSEEALARFEIGFAPGGGQAMRDALSGKGHSIEDLARAGLVTVPEDGRAPYDRFRDRIMFPIRDARGRATGFGGRAMDPDNPAKYYNSPDTELFDKGRSLYNHAPAREAAGKAGSLIVAEGYMDVIALVEAGFAHAVAPLGTAVTETQLQLMWRMADEPVIALDGDRAGIEAGMRLIDRALPHLAPGKSLRFATLPEKLDPDDLIRARGAGAMQTVLDAARPLIDLLWERETARPAATPEQRAAFDEALRALIGRIAHPGVRAHYAAELRARRQALFRPEGSSRPGGPHQGGPWNPGPWSGRTRRGAPGGATAETRASVFGRADADPADAARPREAAILTGCLHHPGVAADLDDALDRAVFLNIDLDALRRALLAALPGCLDAADPRAALSAALAADLGHPPGEIVIRDPAAVPASLRAGADPDRARTVLAATLGQLRAESGIGDEIAEARDRLAEDEAASWRLTEAAQARDQAFAVERGAAKSATVAEETIDSYFRGLRDRQIWVKKTPRDGGPNR